MLFAFCTPFTIKTICDYIKKTLFFPDGWTWSHIFPFSSKRPSKVLKLWLRMCFLFYRYNVVSHQHHMLSLSSMCSPLSLLCQGDRWKGEAVVPSSFLPANVSAFNMFAIHKATPIEEDQVMAKRKMKEMELMLAITMSLTILVIIKKQMIKVEQMFFYCWIQFVCVEISLCYIPKVDDNEMICGMGGWDDIRWCFNNIQSSIITLHYIFNKIQAWEDGKIYEALFPVEQVRKSLRN